MFLQGRHLVGLDKISHNRKENEKMRKSISKLGCMMMACALLAGNILTQDQSVSALDAASVPKETTTMAEPENIPLNTNVSGNLVESLFHFCSITTDNKDVDYEFVFVNDTPSDHSSLRTMQFEVIAAPFRADGNYDISQRVIQSTWVDPSSARTFKTTLSLKKNTRYIIQLMPLAYYTIPYHMSVNQVSKTPAWKKITPKKGKAVVKFTKSQGAKSYEIAVKAKGKAWKTYKTKKNTYTIKKLKAKKNYTIRVRSVCTINGTKKYSAWSHQAKLMKKGTTWKVAYQKSNTP